MCTKKDHEKDNGCYCDGKGTYIHYRRSAAGKLVRLSVFCKCPMGKVVRINQIER